MAAYTLYDASVGVAKDALVALSAIITKAEASSVAASIPAARIHADMLPFSFQVHVVTQTIHKMIARTTGAEPKDYENSGLETFEGMKTRIAEVQSQLEAVDRAAVNGREKETVSFGMGPGRPDAKVESWQYVHGYATPNIYFHLVTAYDIVRKEGVDIGKMDYLDPFLVKFVAGQS